MAINVDAPEEDDPGQELDEEIESLIDSLAMRACERIGPIVVLSKKLTIRQAEHLVEGEIRCGKSIGTFRMLVVLRSTGYEAIMAVIDIGCMPRTYIRIHNQWEVI